MTAKRLSVKQARQTKQKVMLIVSILFFLATTGFSVANLFRTAINSPEAIEQPVSEIPEELLQQQATVYERILEREPTNQTALEGLVDVRLQLNNVTGAIVPLEKLVELYPDRRDYAMLLSQLKQ
ncbi:MAG: tetratricopeptide repeat protein [Cyanobacteria bacterium CRU_2_1]|nr:tetratricopeptide repeat protein [Cyanobacteria bacterium RU_5_0]NJR57615.1 tetratricopeptide repeat protein [Cyanobacteria bacterium CRU_2_1]